MIKPNRVLVILLLVIGACTHAGREQTIQTTLLATNAAREAFVQYDAIAQAKIVDSATSLESGKAQLVEYRAKREKVLALFPVVYYAILAASQANDDASFAEMKTRLKVLLNAVMPLLGGSL